MFLITSNPRKGVNQINQLYLYVGRFCHIELSQLSYQVGNFTHNKNKYNMIKKYPDAQYFKYIKNREENTCSNKDKV